MILYRDIEKRLWEFGLEHGIRIIRKQRPIRPTSLGDFVSNIVHYKAPRKAIKIFLLGVLLGYLPYMIHQGWLL